MAFVSSGDLKVWATHSDAHSPASAVPTQAADYGWAVGTAPATGLSLLARFQTYGEVYKSQVWVYTVVKKLATATARLPLKVYSRGTDGRDEARDSDFAALMRRPNPQHDPFLFWLITASTLEVYGEAVWIKVRNARGVPAQLWPVNPTRLRTVTADEDSPSGQFRRGDLLYVVSDGYGRDVVALGRADVVHFRSFNPDNFDRGLSPLEPLRQTLFNEDAARRATSSFWTNGARPAVALTHPGVISQPAAERLKARWDQIAAGADNTGKTVVLEEGMKPEVMSLSAEEAQYIETRKLNREEVCGAYDVPPPVVHILDRATFSNITEQMRSMYRDTMAPRLSLLESAIDHQLRPDFDSTGNLYAEFLLDEVLRGDFETRVQAWATAIQTGQATIAEARRSENRPFIVGSDRLLTNAAITPLDRIEPALDPNDTGSKEPTPIFGYDLQFGIATIDERRAQLGLPPLPNGQGSHPPLPPGVVQAAATDPTVDGDAAQAVRSVLGRLAWQKTLADVDLDALTQGLNGHAATVTDAFADAQAAGETIPQLRDRIKNLTRETP
jgi:HK97 family phage portal protein